MSLSLRKMFPYVIAGWLPGGQRQCIACGHSVWRFMPYRAGSRDVPPLMRVLNVVGSNPDQFECPRCGAHDRERHLLMYLQAGRILTELHGKSILHFAPERRLSRFIADAAPSRYIRADLCPNALGVERVDMLEMQFEDGSFDCVIANHVLEHVSNVHCALSEIRRVLKPEGLAILQTPYSEKLRHTWEDEGIDTPSARLQAHGQEDHLRLFGRDIFDLISDVGFEKLVRKHEELLPDVDPDRTGVNPREPFFLFRKN